MSLEMSHYYSDIDICATHINIQNIHSFERFSTLNYFQCKLEAIIHPHTRINNANT